MAMSNSESDHHIPLLEQRRSPRRLRSHLFCKWIVIMVMSMQIFFCGLIWTFVGVMIVNKVIPLPDNLAIWIYSNPNETNMSITVISTILGIIVSSLLGTSVQHALTFRLSRTIRLSTTIVWIQFANKSFFHHFRRHLWWTILSALWVCVIGFLTTAWSNLLTPRMVAVQFQRTGQELDFLSPSVSNFFYSTGNMLPIDSTRRNWTLTPKVIDLWMPGLISQSGVSAAMAASDPPSFAFVNYAPSVRFNSSTGGVLPVTSYIPQLLPFGDERHRGLSVTYSFVQQGYTANVSCAMSSSTPSITLNNTVSVQRSTETLEGPVTYALQTWSWITKCSGDIKSYTGEIDVWATSDLPDASPIGNGLFATSVCFYQEFSGSSNQSLLLLMQSPYNSTYNTYYPLGDSSFPTVCQVTPMVTTVQVQYNESGIINIENVENPVQLSDDSWPIVFKTSSSIWSMYFVAQGPYSNSMADDILLVKIMQNATSSDKVILILEQYLRGIVEYMGTSWRDDIAYNLTYSGQPLPENMTIPFRGTMNVQTMGWTFHLRTHAVALATITLVTLVTMASGIFALIEASRQKPVPNTSHQGTSAAFDPTDLMDVLLASSAGNLANALSQCEVKEDWEKLKVELVVTDRGHSVLNARAP